MRVRLPAGCVNELAAVLVLGAVLAGCSSGPPTGEVQGKVTFKGTPVTEGDIIFRNTKEGGQAGAELKSDGTYVVKNPVVVGEYSVIITPPVILVDTDPGKSPPAPVEKPAPNIPQKYRMDGTTPLRAKVESGKNILDFDLKP